MPTTSKPLSFVPKNSYLTQDRNDENHHGFNHLSARTFSVGLRVLGCRSLDTEGTQGIVGTVTELRLSRDNTAVIQWDTGTKETYSAGHHDQQQIFVLDNASIGIAHGGITCKACEQCPIAGLRWKCLECKESSVDLCTSCYMRDKHDRDHSFLRFDTSEKDGTPVERRSKTKKIQVRGIFLGTKVTRGPDWQYGDEDGGPGKFGTVTEITRWEENPTGAVRVAWHSGSEGTYRLGYKAKVDLQCTNEASGGFYYMSHLPRLQQCQQTTPEAEGNLTDISGALREGHALTSHCDIPLSNTTHDTVMQTSQGPAADSQTPTLIITDWEKRGQEAKASRSKLHKESINGNSKAVKMLLNSGEDVNQGDKFLLTPLHLAAWYGQESVVKLLLEGGANVNATDIFQKTPLQKAERHNHQSIIKILQKYGATPSYHQPSTLKSLSKMAVVTVDRRSGCNLLQAMVYEGNFKGVLTASIFLEDFVREMNFKSTASNAKTFPSKTARDMLSTLKKHDHGKIKRFCEETLEKIRTLTELHECGDNDDTEKAVELVLHHGLDVNSPAKGNRTPLLWASLQCSSEFVKTLIDLGAETNARREDKSTPLILATDWKNYMAVHILTKIGADTDAEQMEGKAALHFASCRSANITQCLIESGCNVNLQSATGRTPLHLAVQNKQKHVVKMLLENDADVAKRDKQDPNDRVILVRRKDKGKPAWHVVDVKKTLTGLFHKRVKSGSLDVADFGTVLASGWGTDPPDSKREQILKAHSENTVEIKDKTALHIACEIGDVAIMDLLVEHGADINALDADGFTPLQLAAIRGNMKVVKKLVDLKADVNLTTADGKDAADYAKMNEEVEIEEFLKSKKSLFKKFWNRLSRK